jgi:hypothetical protein
MCSLVIAFVGCATAEDAKRSFTEQLKANLSELSTDKESHHAVTARIGPSS